MTSDPKSLSEAVKAAKDAVHDLEEPLKTEAFKIVLDKLISADGEAPTTQRNRKIKPARGGNQPTKRGGVKKKAPVVDQVSDLKLGVDDLRKLKNYCERFELGGTEQIAFILANFLREHTDKESTRAVDVAYCYRQLVSQKVKVPAVNDAGDWVRALNWLTVPSRKKEWLEKTSDGYAVSPAGLLRFNELETEAKAKSAMSKA